MDSGHTLVLVRYRLMGIIIYFNLYYKQTRRRGGVNPPISKTIIVIMKNET